MILWKNFSLHDSSLSVISPGADHDLHDAYFEKYPNDGRIGGRFISGWDLKNGGWSLDFPEKNPQKGIIGRILSGSGSKNGIESLI